MSDVTVTVKALKAVQGKLKAVRLNAETFRTNAGNVFIWDRQTSANYSPLEPKGSQAVAVKDNIASLNGTTTCASNFLKDYKSPFDAFVIQRLEAHGAHLIGKTNMDEFGMGSYSTHSHFGTVQSRVNRLHNRSIGGSSGGSAVAVASTVAHVALGTDTGGSVRLPAAYVGVAGFKPSYGMISRFGVVPYANSLDTVGLFARSCHQLEVYLQSIRKADPQDPTSHWMSSRERFNTRNRQFSKRDGYEDSKELEGLRIGVPIEYNIEELEEPIRDNWRRVLEGLQQKGHEIVPVSLPSTKHALSAYYIIAAAEASSNMAKFDGVRYGSRGVGSDRSGDVLYAKSRGEGFGDEVKRRILLGSYTLSSEAINNYFIKAQKVRRMVQRDFDRVFAMPNPLHDEEQFDLSDMDDDVVLENKLGPAQVDVLICPTAPTLPPLLENLEDQSPIDAYMNDVFTVPASLAGLPALSIPVLIRKELQESNNTPYSGIQVIGQFWEDVHVLKVGQMIMSVMGN